MPLDTVLGRGESLCGRAITDMAILLESYESDSRFVDRGVVGAGGRELSAVDASLRLLLARL